MTVRWITLLEESPSLVRMAQALTSKSFHVAGFPEHSSNVIIRLKCRICDHEMKPAVYDATNCGVGAAIIKSLIEDVERRESGKHTKHILQHLGRTACLVLTESEPFIRECDCEARFHEVVAGTRYLWYVEDDAERIFADEHETLMELDSRDSTFTDGNSDRTMR